METEIVHNTTVQHWTLDKSHARLGFTITHMLVSEVDRSFKNFDITINGVGEDFHHAAVELTADISSIDTQNEGRDEHLKKEDFFNVNKYPSLHFREGILNKVDEGKYELKGNLTLLGVTKPVTLNVKSRVGKHPMKGHAIAGFKVSGTIKRSDFALAPSAPGIVLSDEVEINANAEFIQS